MWHEVHWNRFLNKLALYEGTMDGYKVTKVYSTKIGAKLSAKFHGWKYCG